MLLFGSSTIVYDYHLQNELLNSQIQFGTFDPSLQNLYNI